MNREPFVSDHAWKQDIIEGSRKLLVALWISHPQIMRKLKAQRP